MKYLITCLLLSIVLIGHAQTHKHLSMRKELMKVNDYYQKLYVQNSKIDHLFKKITEYRSNAALGINEYASPDEVEGLEWFEVLQKQRDEITLSIYTDYQSAAYVELMDDYNKKRKALRTQLAHREITWRQFVDELQELIQKNRAQEKLYWEETTKSSMAFIMPWKMLTP